MGEAAQAHVSIYPKFASGFRTQIAREVSSAGTQSGRQFGQGFQRAAKQGGLGKIGGMVKGGLIGLAAQFTVGALVDGFNDLTGAASDLSETVNKSRTIFGRQFAGVDQWARNAAKNLGLSRQEALNAASGFGDMFRQLGFTGKSATDMSKQVVQMSADLGSFNNLPTAEVSDKIAAAFRGEYDSLQSLIPNINAARVEQQAMATTGKKNAKELTAQEKAAAVLAIVSKDGARAMGDFAKTANDSANKAKTNAARLDDLKGRFGTLLQPIQKLAQDGFSKLLEAGEGVTAFLEKNPEVMAGFIAGFQLASDAVKGFIEFVGPGVAFVVAAMARSFAGFMRGVAGFLDVLGNIPGFGWAKDAAAKLNTAATGAEKLATGLENIPKNTTPHVDVADAVAKAKIKRIDAEIDRLSKKRVKVKSDGDTKGVDKIDNRIKKLQRQRNQISVGVGLRRSGPQSVKLTRAELDKFALKFAAAGGLVRGPGTGTSDSVGARLSNLEYVTRASSVRKVGLANMDYINKYGRLPINAAEISGGGTVVNIQGNVYGDPYLISVNRRDQMRKRHEMQRAGMMV